MTRRKSEGEATFNSCCTLCQNEGHSGATQNHGFSERSRARSTSVSTSDYGGSSCGSCNPTCNCSGHRSQAHSSAEGIADSVASQGASSEEAYSRCTCTSSGSSGSVASQGASSEEACSRCTPHTSSGSSDSCSDDESDCSGCSSAPSTEGNPDSACITCLHGTSYQRSVELHLPDRRDATEASRNGAAHHRSRQVDSPRRHAETCNVEARGVAQLAAFSPLSASAPSALRGCRPSLGHGSAVTVWAEAAEQAPGRLQNESDSGASNNRLRLRHSRANCHVFPNSTDPVGRRTARTQQWPNLPVKIAGVCDETAYRGPTKMQTSQVPSQQCGTADQHRVPSQHEDAHAELTLQLSRLNRMQCSSVSDGGPHTSQQGTAPPLTKSWKEGHVQQRAQAFLKPCALLQQKNSSTEFRGSQGRNNDIHKYRRPQGACVGNPLCPNSESYETPCSFRSNDEVHCYKDTVTMQLSVGSPPVDASSAGFDVSCQPQLVPQQSRVPEKRRQLVVATHAEVVLDRQRGESQELIPPEGCRPCEEGNPECFQSLSTPQQHHQLHMVQHAVGGTAACAEVSAALLVHQKQQNPPAILPIEEPMHEHLTADRCLWERSSGSARATKGAFTEDKQESAVKAAAHTSARVVVHEEEAGTICVHTHVDSSIAAISQAEEALIPPNAVKLCKRLQKTQRTMEMLKIRRNQEKRGHLQGNPAKSKGLTRVVTHAQDIAVEQLQEQLTHAQEQLKQAQEQLSVYHQQARISELRASEADTARMSTEKQLSEKDERVKRLEKQLQQHVDTAAEQENELERTKKEFQQAKQPLRDIENREPCDVQTELQRELESRDETTRRTGRQLHGTEEYVMQQELECMSITTEIRTVGALEVREGRHEIVGDSESATQQQVEKKVKELQTQLQEAHQRCEEMKAELSALREETKRQQELQQTLKENAEDKTRQETALTTQKQAEELVEGNLLVNHQLRTQREVERKKLRRSSASADLDEQLKRTELTEELQRLRHQCHVQQQEVEYRLMWREQLDAELLLLTEQQNPQLHVDETPLLVRRPDNDVESESLRDMQESRVGAHQECCLHEVAENAILKLQLKDVSKRFQAARRIWEHCVQVRLQRAEDQQKERSQEQHDGLKHAEFSELNEESLTQHVIDCPVGPHDALERMLMRQEDMEQHLLLAQARERELREQHVKQQRRHESQLRELQENLARARQAIQRPQQQTTSAWRNQNGGLLRQQLHRSESSPAGCQGIICKQLESSRLYLSDTAEYERGEQSSLRTRCEHTKKQSYTLENQQIAGYMNASVEELQCTQREETIEKHVLRRDQLHKEVDETREEADYRNNHKQKEQQRQLMCEKPEKHDAYQEKVVERVDQQLDIPDEKLKQTRQDKEKTECRTRLESEQVSTHAQGEQQAVQQEAAAEERFCQLREESEQEAEETIKVDDFTDCRDELEGELQSMHETLQEQHVQDEERQQREDLLQKLEKTKQDESMTERREQLESERRSVSEKLQGQEVQYEERLRQQREEFMENLEKTKQEESMIERCEQLERERRSVREKLQEQAVQYEERLQLQREEFMQKLEKRKREESVAERCEQLERELQSMHKKLQEQAVQYEERLQLQREEFMQKLEKRKREESVAERCEQLERELQSMRGKLQVQDVQHKERLRRQREEFMQKLEKTKQEESVTERCEQLERELRSMHEKLQVQAVQYAKRLRQQELEKTNREESVAERCKQLERELQSMHKKLQEQAVQYEERLQLQREEFMQKLEKRKREESVAERCEQLERELQSMRGKLQVQDVQYKERLRRQREEFMQKLEKTKQEESVTERCEQLERELRSMHEKLQVQAVQYAKRLRQQELEKTNREESVAERCKQLERELQSMHKKLQEQAVQYEERLQLQREEFMQKLEKRKREESVAERCEQLERELQSMRGKLQVQDVQYKERLRRQREEFMQKLEKTKQEESVTERCEQLERELRSMHEKLQVQAVQYAKRLRQQELEKTNREESVAERCKQLERELQSMHKKLQEQAVQYEERLRQQREEFKQELEKTKQEESMTERGQQLERERRSVREKLQEQAVQYEERLRQQREEFKQELEKTKQEESVTGRGEQLERELQLLREKPQEQRIEQESTTQQLLRQQRDKCDPELEKWKQEDDTTERKQLQCELQLLHSKLEQLETQREHKVAEVPHQRHHSLERDQGEQLSQERAIYKQPTEEREAVTEGTMHERGSETSSKTLQHVSRERVVRQGQQAPPEDAVQHSYAETQNVKKLKQSAAERYSCGLEGYLHSSQTLSWEALRGSKHQKHCGGAHERAESLPQKSVQGYGTQQHDFGQVKNTREGQRMCEDNERKLTVATTLSHRASTAASTMPENRALAEHLENTVLRSKNIRLGPGEQTKELTRTYGCQTPYLRGSNDMLLRRGAPAAGHLHARSAEHVSGMQAEQPSQNTSGRSEVCKAHSWEYTIFHQWGQLNRQVHATQRQQREQEKRLQQIYENNKNIHRRLQQPLKHRNGMLEASAAIREDGEGGAIESAAMQRAALYERAFISCRNKERCSPAATTHGYTSAQLRIRTCPAAARSATSDKLDNASSGNSDGVDSRFCKSSLDCHRAHQHQTSPAHDPEGPSTASGARIGVYRPPYLFSPWAFRPSAKTSSIHAFKTGADPHKAAAAVCKGLASSTGFSSLTTRASLLPATDARLYEALVVEIHNLEHLLLLRDYDIQALLNLLLEKNASEQREPVESKRSYRLQSNATSTGTIDNLCNQTDPEKNCNSFGLFSHVVRKARQAAEAVCRTDSVSRIQTVDNARMNNQHLGASEMCPAGVHWLPSFTSSQAETAQHQQHQRVGVLMALMRTQNLVATGSGLLLQQQLSPSDTCVAVTGANAARPLRPLHVRCKQLRDETPYSRRGDTNAISLYTDAQKAFCTSSRGSALECDGGSRNAADLLDRVLREWQAALRDHHSQNIWRCIDPAGSSALTFNKTPFFFLLTSRPVLLGISRLHTGSAASPTSCHSESESALITTYVCRSSCMYEATARDRRGDPSRSRSADEELSMRHKPNTMHCAPWAGQNCRGDSVKELKQENRRQHINDQAQELARWTSDTKQHEQSRQARMKVAHTVYHLSALTRTRRTREYKYATLDASPPRDTLQASIPVLFNHFSPGAARLNVDLPEDSHKIISLSFKRKVHTHDAGALRVAEAGRVTGASAQLRSPCVWHSTDRDLRAQSGQVPRFQRMPLVARLRELSFVSECSTPLYVAFFLKRPERAGRLGEPNISGSVMSPESEANVRQHQENIIVTRLTEAPVDESLLFLHFCTEKTVRSASSMGSVGGGHRLCWSETQSDALEEQLEGRHFIIEHALSGLYFALKTSRLADCSQCCERTRVDVSSYSSIASDVETLAAFAQSRGVFSLKPCFTVGVASGLSDGLAFVQSRADKPGACSDALRRPRSKENSIYSSFQSSGPPVLPSSRNDPQMSRLIAVSDADQASLFVFTKEATLPKFRAACQVVSEEMRQPTPEVGGSL